MRGSLLLLDSLLEVLREGPATTRTLARRLGADRFTVEDTLARLRKAGAVARDPAATAIGPYFVHRLTDEPHHDLGGLATTAPPG